MGIIYFINIKNLKKAQLFLSLRPLLFPSLPPSTLSLSHLLFLSLPFPLTYSLSYSFFLSLNFFNKIMIREREKGRKGEREKGRKRERKREKDREGENSGAGVFFY